MNRVHIAGCLLVLGLAGLFVMGLLIGLGGEPARAANGVVSLDASPQAAGVAQANSWPWNIEFVSRLGGTGLAVAVADSWVYLSVASEILVLDTSNPTQPRLVGRVTDLLDRPREMQPTGRYLYAASGKAGLWVIDVGDPAHPIPVGRFDTAGYARSVVISRSLAYVGSDSGLQVLDISTPISPTEVAYLPMNLGVHYTVKVIGQYAYIAYVAGDCGGGLRIIDVSTPTLPVEVGAYQACIGRIAVTGTYVYASIWDEPYTLRVLDVSDPSKPEEIASLDTQSWIGDLAVQGRYLYITLPSGLLKVVDISNPLSPTWVAALDSGGRFIHRMAAVGRYLYIVAPYNGLWTVDVVSPTQPVSVGWFESYEIGPAWGMVASGNYAYVSGLRGGLGIVSIANRMNPVLVGGVSGDSPLIFDFEVMPPYLYASPWAGKIIAYDISVPYRPVEAGVFDIRDSGRFFTFARRDSLLFAAESGENAAPPGRFRVLDISNPANITQVGIYTYTPPVPVGGGLEGVVLSGTYAYVGARGYGLLVIDISDPAHPTLAGSLDIFTNQRDVGISGNLVYVSDAFGERRGIHILDISNPISPTPVGFYDTGSANPYSFAVLGHYLYVPAGDALRIVDVSDPALPVELARYEGLCGYLNSVFVDWPYAYVGAQECGLYAFWFVPGVQNAPIPPSGGVLTSEADNISYSFPPGTFTETVLIDHIPRFEGNLPPVGNLEGIGKAFEVRAVYSDTGETAQPLGIYTITVSYDEQDRGVVVEDSLGLYYWDGERWIREPSSSVDTVANIVTATPDHFSLWAVLGETRKVYLPLVLRRR